MSSEINDILKLLDLDQTAIDALSDKVGLYNNTTTGNLEYNGSEIGGSGTAESLDIITLTSTDNSGTFTEASPLVVPWDTETEKDSGFTHSNITNNTRITVADTSTYQFGGALRIFNDDDQRLQPLPKLLIDGVEQDDAVDSGYIRFSGAASDYWSLEFTFRPLKLTAGQYAEIQIGLEPSNPSTYDGTLIGDESNFWGVKLQGGKGAKGDTGAGSNIIVKKNGVTVGTVSDVINFITSLSVVDSGGNETEVTIGDMLKSVYDPTGVNADAFDYSNAIGIYTDVG